MTNPFETIAARLSNIEGLLLDIKHGEPKQSTTTDRLMTIKEAAAFINLSPATVYNLVMRRQIPYMKNRQRLYFSEKDLRTWIEAGRQKTLEEIESEAKESMVK